MTSNRERAYRIVATNTGSEEIAEALDAAERRGEERMRERAATFVDGIIDSLIGLHIRALPLGGAIKYSCDTPVVLSPELFVQCSSFPPFVWELCERSYPNKRIAASRDVESIHAAVRLYRMGTP